ncbi:MAG TPA: phosphoribosylglycinamide formyltransferase [Candidatus Methanoperedens sp.]|nr:phosphoribosylglycinamide formyltransferase [Candidatus Methanoperedens sp.]
MSAAPLALGVLASGRGSNLQAILDAVAAGRLDASVRAVVSDVADAFALERARRAGVPAVFVDPQGPGGKAGFEGRIVARLREHGVDAVALAGYMRVCGPTLLAAFAGRVVNIHPSLLPAFPGLHVQRAALAHGVRFSGCTVHFVDAGVDTGPIIAQAVVPVLDGDTEESLAARILRQEHCVFPLALQLLAAGRLRLDGRRVLVEGRAPAPDSAALLNPPADA